MNLSDTFNFSDFDTRQHEYPLDMLVSIPAGEVAVKITVYTLLILIALIGNTLIILVVLKNKRMQTTTNYFLVNLAVSDLVVSLSCSWVHLVDDLTEGWVLGDFFCPFNTFAQVASLVSSILSLTLVACDRFFGIVYAMKAHIIERKAKPVIIAIWVISAAVALPMLIYRRVHERHWKNHVEKWCDDVEWWIDLGNGESHYHRPARVAYWTCVSVILFFLPIIAMVGAYCGIIKTLWSTKIPGERVYKENMVQTKMKRKVIIMLIVILAVFALCWCPLQITILYSEYRGNHTERLEEWYIHLEFSARLLAFSNSAFNPLIYAGFNENFRKGLFNLLGCYKKIRWTPVNRMDSFRSTTFNSTKSEHLDLNALKLYKRVETAYPSLSNQLTAIIFLKKALSAQRQKRYIPCRETRRSTTTVTFNAIQAEDVL